MELWNSAEEEIRRASQMGEWQLGARLVQAQSNTLNSTRALVRNVGLSYIVEAFELAAEEFEFHLTMSRDSLEGFLILLPLIALVSVCTHNLHICSDTYISTSKHLSYLPGLKSLWFKTQLCLSLPFLCLSIFMCKLGIVSIIKLALVLARGE